MRNDDRRYWLDEPRNQNRVFWLLVAICGLLMLADLFVHRHAYFSWDGWFNFYGFFGFAAFWLIVIAGKHLRKLLKRDEDYYD
jgi:hypothetical protein